MAEAPVVEKMARQAKKICDVRDDQRDVVVMMSIARKTHEQRSQLRALVIEASDDTQTEDGDDGVDVPVHGEGTTTEPVGSGTDEDDGDELHACEDDGDRKRLLVTRELDCRRKRGVHRSVITTIIANMRLTELGRVCVKHGQTDELLHNFWPRGDEQPPSVDSLENGELALLLSLGRDPTFFFDGCDHDSLQVMPRRSEE